MGGDTFQGIQKLTNSQFQALIPQITDQISKIVSRISVYLPIPQKQIHGDIDFIIIFQEGFGFKDILQILKIERYIVNNNDTLNTVYKQKQVDFCYVHTHSQFESLAFYKSYSGLGAYLGSFLSSFDIKLSTLGLFAIQHQGHVHYELQLTNKPQKILQFYGMSYQIYSQGFKTRKDLFQFLRTCRFLDQEKYVQIQIDNLPRRQSRSIGKLTKQFVLYLRQSGPRKKQNIQMQENLKISILQYYGKKQEFDHGINVILQQNKRRQILSKKFNANHLIQTVKVPLKQVDGLKRKFIQSFGDQENYLKFVEQNELQIILEQFNHRCKFEKNENDEIAHPRKKKQKNKKNKQAQQRITQNKMEYNCKKMKKQQE